MNRNLIPTENRTALLISVCSLLLVLHSVSSFDCLAGEGTGWRADGTGRFPSESPPTRWSRDEGILWKAELPSTSLASPVAISDRVFVMSEPNRLLCYRASDGTLLWDRPHEYDAIFPAEKVSEIRQQHVESQRIREEIAELEKQLKAQQDAKAPATEISLLEARIHELRIRDEQLTVIPPPQADSTGNTASTPVCDGENIYAVFANGIVSSHGADGQLNWIRFVEKPTPRHSASPLIVGNLLIVHLQHLLALDRDTGEIVWTAETAPRNGSPVAAMAGDHEIIVTPAGAIVSAKDGQILAEDLFNLTYSSVTVHGGIIYAAERGEFLAIQVAPDPGNNTIAAKILWKTRGAEVDRLASPVVHEQLLFSATDTGILDILDTTTGKIVNRKRMELGEGRVDASLSVADNFLFVHSTNGASLIMNPTAQCSEVTRNQADGLSTTPFFVNNTMLLRTPTHLVCIGAQPGSCSSHQ
jgi:hypothetical protein